MQHIDTTTAAVRSAPVSFATAWASARGMANGFMASLPRLATGAVVLLIVYLIAKAVRALIVRAARRDGAHAVLEVAIGRIVQGAIVLVGLLFAMTIIFPSFTAGNLISSLGIGGVAIGFAFKDIFQNFLAGLLLLVTKPFNVGDEIRFKEYEGVVEDIQSRATYLRTGEGRRVVIPNSDLFVNSVTVNTARPAVRVHTDIRIGYQDDVDRAKQLIGEAMHAAEGVKPDPKADVILFELAPTWVTLRARWWVDPRASVSAVQDRLLVGARARLVEAGMKLQQDT